ncbi:MAG: methyltransferase domain-containing protein [Rhodospirillales bacterium]
MPCGGGLIPCYDAFYGTALALIADARPSPTLRILDLGAGTGLLSAMLLEQFPAALLHLMDASAGMLEQARRRFAGHPAVGTRRHGSGRSRRALGCSRLGFSHPPPGRRSKAGAVPAHPPRVAAGRHLRQRRAGVGAGPAGGGALRAHLARRDPGARRSEDEIARAAERMAHDHCAPVEDQLRWLREAGFADVDCSFKAWRFAVFSGRA